MLIIGPLAHSKSICSEKCRSKGNTMFSASFQDNIGLFLRNTVTMTVKNKVIFGSAFPYHRQLRTIGKSFYLFVPVFLSLLTFKHFCLGVPFYVLCEIPLFLHRRKCSVNIIRCKITQYYAKALYIANQQVYLKMKSPAIVCKSADIKCYHLACLDIEEPMR